jgi:hypothetical protein
MRAWVEYAEFDGTNTPNVDSKFFPELPLSCLGVRLATLAFSTRKFPQPAVALVEGALTDE